MTVEEQKQQNWEREDGYPTLKSAIFWAHREKCGYDTIITKNYRTSKEFPFVVWRKRNANKKT